MPGGAAKSRRNLEKEEESMELGILTLLPPIVILLMAKHYVLAAGGRAFVLHSAV